MGASFGIVIVIVTGLVSIVGLNLSAAGIVACFYLWRRKVPVSTRAMLAAGLAGLLPVLASMAPLAMQIVEGGQEAVIMLVVIAMVLAVSTVLSLPGALVVSRKLQQPLDHRAFE